MKLNSTKVERRYIFTQKELCEKLGIEGTIRAMGLWSGLSPDEEGKGESTDKNEWEITTLELFK
ncbi:MAG: hypothetical protein EHJ95_04870 [Methanobacteriota archaeon]|nr:MAG: hypothetical protein EHJ95_04870 [Euryarchaeota archaeon]